MNMRSVPEVEHVVPTPVTEHMASAPAQSHADVSAGVKSDITWTKELAEIRQMLEFLVRRERKVDTHAGGGRNKKVGAIGEREGG